MIREMDRFAPVLNIAGLLVLADNDWIVALVLTVLIGSVAFFWIVIGLEKRRMRIKELIERKICVVCGYDMRATPEVCPECGSPVIGGPLPPGAYDLDAPNRDLPQSAIEARLPDPGEPPFIFYETTSETEAKLLVAQLKARGIQAHVGKGEPTGAMSGEVLECRFKVFIWSGDRELAIAVARRFQAS